MLAILQRFGWSIARTHPSKWLWGNVRHYIPELQVQGENKMSQMFLKCPGVIQCIDLTRQFPGYKNRIVFYILRVLCHANVETIHFLNSFTCYLRKWYMLSHVWSRSQGCFIHRDIFSTSFSPLEGTFATFLNSFPLSKKVMLRRLMLISATQSAEVGTKRTLPF